MKKYLVLIILFSCIIKGAAQDKFIYNQKGLSPIYLVNEIDNHSDDVLFNKCIEWIKKSYKNPDQVIKTTIQNKIIRIEAVSPNWICIKSLGDTLCSDALYTINFEFKDGKYKFEVLSLTLISKNGNYKVNLKEGTDYYKKNGKLKKFTKDTPKAISDLFNKLNKELKDYILNKGELNKDW